LEESVELARALGEPWLLANTQLHVILNVLTSAAIQRVEERARARAAGVESLRLFQATGVRLEAAMVQLFLGQLALYEGDYARARAAFVACLPTIRTLGWRSAVAAGLVGLADVARDQGQAGEATAFYAEGLALYRQVGDQCLIARALCRLANQSLEQDDWAVAQTFVAEILAIAQDRGQVEAPQLAGALEVGAALAEIQGAPVRAVRLAGAAAALHAQGERLAASVGGMPAAASRPTRQRLALDCPALSAAEQATAWEEGQAMRREQAIAYALSGVPAEHGASLRHPPEQQRERIAASTNQRLSPTERLTWTLEHLRTVGPLSPRECMAALGIGRRTAVRDLRVLEARGLVAAQGTTTDRRYALRRDGP
jgi:tetratricopeptide (TPR) repeat protein